MFSQGSTLSPPADSDSECLPPRNGARRRLFVTLPDSQPLSPTDSVSSPACSQRNFVGSPLRAGDGFIVDIALTLGWTGETLEVREVDADVIGKGSPLDMSIGFDLPPTPEMEETLSSPEKEKQDGGEGAVGGHVGPV